MQNALIENNEINVRINCERVPNMNSPGKYKVLIHLCTSPTIHLCATSSFQFSHSRISIQPEARHCTVMVCLHRINRIPERALRIVYKHYDVSFDSLLEKSGAVNHSTEIYKVFHDLSPTLMKEIFQLRNSQV